MKFYTASKFNFRYKVLILCLFPLTACISKQKNSSNEQNRQIIVTIEPLRYFVNKIAGNDYQVETLVPEGADPESYDPAPAQLIRLSNARLFFKVGHLGVEEIWKKSIEETAPEITIINTSEGFVPPLPEHNSENIVHDHHGHSHGGEGDPHTWSSIEGARTIALNIKKALIDTYPSDSSNFEQNYQSLTVEIDSVESALIELLLPIENRSFMIYHPSLTYFAGEFGFNQLPIETEGKEPSPKQLKQLIEKARNEKVKVIFIQREFDTKQAETIAKETGTSLIEIAPLSYDWRNEMIHIGKSLAR